MYEIAISPASQQFLPHTHFDIAVGHQFASRARAEQFACELNTFCYQDRFVVVPASQAANAAMPAVA